ncbi:MAG: hypothetical protein AAB468_02215 [Patescibacteria group bacterium]
MSWNDLAALPAVVLSYLWATIKSTSVVWLPVFLGYLLQFLWRRYKQAQYILGTPWTILEVKLPKEISKSPHAMEVVMGVFNQSYEGNPLTRLTKGIVRSWFSLELVSIEGTIHFYIRLPKFFKDLVEAQIYSQYPEVEVTPVDDYVTSVPYGLPGSDWQLWGMELGLSKEDAYPIKTYIDYGLEKDPKEEFKIDPMTPTLELLGSVGAGEQIWLQIIIMAAKNRLPKPGTWFGSRSWQDEGKELIKKQMKRDQKAEGQNFGALILSPGERDVVAALERSISKAGYDTGIRVLYLARKDKFSIANTVGLLTSFRQYNSLHLNGFKPVLRTSFDYPWQDYKGKRLELVKRRMFNAYTRRGYFYPPYRKTKPFVLNAEELATIYHFPGSVAKTPTLGHIESKKGEPPINLPI